MKRLGGNGKVKSEKELEKVRMLLGSRQQKQKREADPRKKAQQQRLYGTRMSMVPNSIVEQQANASCFRSLDLQAWPVTLEDFQASVRLLLLLYRLYHAGILVDSWCKPMEE